MGEGAALRVVRRAQIVLLAADGLSNREIGSLLGIHYNRVAVWRRRYAAMGIRGLEDEERSGRPPIYGPNEIVEMLRVLRDHHGGARARWTLADLAAGLSERRIPISASQVRRLCTAIEVDSSFVANENPVSSPVPLDCPLAIIGICLGDGVRAIFTATVDPASASPSAEAFFASVDGGGLVDELEAVLGARRGTYREEHPLPIAVRLQQLSYELLRCVPDDVVISCTVEHLAPSVVERMRTAAPGRFFVHPTTRRGSWDNRVELLLSLVGRHRDKSIVADADPQAHLAVAIKPLEVGNGALLGRLHELERNAATWSWSLSSTAAAAAR